MLNLIARPAHLKSRVFPDPWFELSLSTGNSGLNSDQRVARDLLSIAEGAPRGWRRGSSPTYLKRFARSMSRHRSAVDAELEGQFNRADYFWGLVYPDLRSQLSDDAAWSGLVASVAGDKAATEMADPVRARTRLIAEVLLDTHIAFYNGHAEVESSNSRAGAHLDYIVSLLDISGLSAKEVWRLAAPALHDRIRISRAAGNWVEALGACDLLIEYASAESAPLGLLATLCESYALAEPTSVDENISRLERVNEAYPPDLDVLQTLGRLYESKADELGRSYCPSGALVAIQKALIYAPNLEAGHRTLDRLVEQMKALQADMDAFQLRLSLEPEVKANAVGDWLLMESHRGLGPMQEFAASEEATRLRNSFTCALACALWRDLGLSESVEDLGEHQLRLLKAVTDLTQLNGISPADLQTEWKQIAKGSPILAGIDASAATSALTRLQSGEPGKAQGPPSFARPTQAPLLRVATRTRQVAAEPFRDWLLSTRGLRIKLQVAVAVILLVYVGVVGVHDRKVQRLRDQAFVGVLQAADSNQPRGVVECAETFLSNPAAAQIDPREHKVLGYYEQALVQWLLEAAPEPAEEVRRHLDRYHELTSAMKRGEL